MRQGALVVVIVVLVGDGDFTEAGFAERREKKRIEGQLVSLGGKEVCEACAGKEKKCGRGEAMRTESLMEFDADDSLGEEGAV